MSTTPDSDAPAATLPTSSAGKNSSKPGPKKKPGAPALLIHPKQALAIKYVNLMSNNFDSDGAELAAQFQAFVTDALAQHLGRAQRRGTEFPPKMLAELQELGLLK